MKLRYRLRYLGRDIRRFPGDLWRVIRRWWWMATDERRRVLAENASLREWNDIRFEQYREARDAFWTLKVEHRGSTVDELRAIADQIDCDGRCEEVGPQCPETGVRECRLSDRGECPFDKASGLRDLASALEVYAKLHAEGEVA